MAHGVLPVEEVLAAAAGPTRTFEARLTGGQPYAKLAPVMRGSTEERKNWRLLKALEDAQKTAQKQRSPEHIRAVGAAQLLLRDADAAVETLRKGSESYPRDASLLSDLAAAYQSRFESSRTAKDLEAAFTAANRAVELNPRLPEARFNKALILQKLGFRQPAAKEWNEYLKLDPGSGWRDEAQRHHDALSTPPLSKAWPQEKERLDRAARAQDEAEVLRIVKRFPRASSAFVEEEILPRWASSGSDPDLIAARAIANGVLTVTGDPLLRDSVLSIDHAGSRPGKPRPTTRGSPILWSRSGEQQVPARR